MHQIFPPTVLTTGIITCPKCHWQGKGSDTTQEELFLTDAIELFCPCCKNYLGFVTNAPQE